jgi:hypothetical protein
MVGGLDLESKARSEGGPPHKIYFPSAEKVMEKALLSSNVLIGCLVAKSQSVVPWPPEAKYCPSG